MPNDPPIHHRHSMRLQGYHYGLSGGYFLTIVTQRRLSLFGEVDHGGMEFNVPGRMVARWWKELEIKFPNVRLDEFVIMPNHIHGIILLMDDFVGADLRVVPDHRGEHIGSPLRERDHAGPTIGQIVQWFKTMTTNEYIREVKTLGWRKFEGKLWQRNFYDHIIRNQDDLDHARVYIQTNPLNWITDSENQP